MNKMVFSIGGYSLFDGLGFMMEGGIKMLILHYIPCVAPDRYVKLTLYNMWHQTICFRFFVSSENNNFYMLC